LAKERVQRLVPGATKEEIVSTRSLVDDMADDGPDMSLFDFGDSDEEDAKPKSKKAAPSASSPTAAGAAESSDDAKAILKRHRQEEQQIRTDAKAKVRGIPKGDRAAKQAADDELEAALEEMRSRHANELAAVAGADGAATLEAGVAGMSVSGGGGGGNGNGNGNGGKGGKKKSKKQKADEAERAREQRIADHHAGAGPSERDIESGKLDAILAPLGLAVHEIPADGHCLYRSLAHQLQVSGEVADFLQCRKDIAAYMRAHPDDFAPYLEEGCPDLNAYCEVVESSNEWGGQLEITALAHARKRTITVYAADAPPLHTGEEYEDPSPILLAFHRHFYGLGEHYNAVGPR